MTWILMMGPTKWAPGHHPELPPELGSHLPRAWSRRGLEVLWPIDVRALLVGLLRKEGHDAVLMEEDPREGKDPHLRHFARLVRFHLKGRFFIYWPLRATLHGVDWEMAHLGTRIEDRVLGAEQVHLFPEEGVVDFDPEADALVFHEEGGRTHYDEDLGRWGCRLHPWADYETLMEKVVEAGAEEPPQEL